MFGCLCVCEFVGLWVCLRACVCLFCVFACLWVRVLVCLRVVSIYEHTGILAFEIPCSKYSIVSEVWHNGIKGGFCEFVGLWVCLRSCVCLFCVFACLTRQGSANYLETFSAPPRNLPALPWTADLSDEL